MAVDSEKTFNIVILGVGGQGLMTMLRLLSEAAFSQGLDVKTSELHGLSQRGGSVSVYIRFGEKVWSPLVPQNQANLVIALEQQEALNGLYFANKQTVFLVNRYETPTMDQMVDQAEVAAELKKIVKPKQVKFLPASTTCQKEFGSDIFSGIYLLGYAVSGGFLPLKTEILQAAVKKTVAEKYWEVNLQALELGQKDGQV